jgi:hypothetical protein
LSETSSGHLRVPAFDWGISGEQRDQTICSFVIG